MEAPDDEVVEAFGALPDEVPIYNLMNIDLVIDPSGVFTYFNKYLNKGV